MTGPKGSVDHVNIMKACINEITLWGHISAELESKKKNKLQNIFYTEFVILYGSKSLSSASKVKFSFFLISFFNWGYLKASYNKPKISRSLHD